MNLTTTQEKQFRKIGYQVLGKNTIKKTVPLIDRLMGLTFKSNSQRQLQERNVELVAAGALAAIFLIKGISRGQSTAIKQGLLITGALGATLFYLKRTDRNRSRNTNADAPMELGHS